MILMKIRYKNLWEGKGWVLGVVGQRAGEKVYILFNNK